MTRARRLPGPLAASAWAALVLGGGGAPEAAEPGGGGGSSCAAGERSAEEPGAAATCAPPDAAGAPPKAPAARAADADDPVRRYCDVARRAGPQAHSEYCTKCQERRRFKSFVPQGEAAIRERLLSARAAANATSGTRHGTGGLLRTAWFMTVVKPFGKDAAKMARYMDFLKAAVVSGLLNAPRLAPYVIYAYSAGQAFGEVDDVYSWLLAAGVRVVPHRLSFEDPLTDEAVSQEANLNVGCWVRLDIAGLVADQLAQEFEQLGIDTGYVLYTDADVMLAGDFPPHEQLTYCRGCAGYPEPACCGERLPPGRPEWFLAGSDADMLPYQMNSGVMYLNVSRMAREMPRLVDYASSKNWAFPNKDNGLLAMYFTRGRPTTDSEDKLWDQFDDALYNSRAFMRRAGRSALIWHWHGFKPGDVRCWLRELEAGRMQQFVFSCSDKSLNNKLANDQVAKDTCSYYLHVQLLGQYERLLAIAGRIEEYLA